MRYAQDEKRVDNITRQVSMRNHGGAMPPLPAQPLAAFAAV